jgi:hypothetical protein
MMRKSLGWIALYVCLLAVAFAIFHGPHYAPEPAQAAVAPSEMTPAWDTTQACQAVVNQMVTIQRITADEARSAHDRFLSALDECVAQEYQIDTSNCPADFRIAALRFIAAEDSARIHAHIDKTGQAENFLAACFEVMTPRFTLSSKSLVDNETRIADEQKQDFAKIQSAGLDLAQVALKYGVK